MEQYELQHRPLPGNNKVTAKVCEWLCNVETATSLNCLNPTLVMLPAALHKDQYILDLE